MQSRVPLGPGKFHVVVLVIYLIQLKQGNRGIVASKEKRELCVHLLESAVHQNNG